MHISNEENLKVIQKWIPEATLDSLEELDTCMNTDAIFKYGVPAAAVSASMAYYMIPNQLKSMKIAIVAGAGLLSFMFGRIVYGGTVCQQKVFGPLIAKRKNSKLYDSPNFIDDISYESQQNKIVTSSDKLLENDSLWTNFDSYSDSNVSYFDDTGNNFQQDLPAEQLSELPVEEKQPTQEIKKRVTYDDLWMQYKDPQMKWYRNFGYNLV